MEKITIVDVNKLILGGIVLDSFVGGAVKVVDNDGLDSMEKMRLKENGGVERVIKNAEGEMR